jgi:RNA polymerase-binding transcription factor DksA
MDLADLADLEIESQLQVALAQFVPLRALSINMDPFCSDCAATIPAQRRAAVPHASLCVECAAALERRARLPEATCALTGRGGFLW